MDPLRAQQLAAELEVEMMADMYNRMTSACHRKCVPPHYKEAELSKGESVCLDRCVSKYLDIHERMGKKLTELSMQDEEVGQLVGWGCLTAEGAPNKRLLPFHGLAAPGTGEGWKVLSNESERRKSVFEIPQEGPLGQEKVASEWRQPG